MYAGALFFQEIFEWSLYPSVITILIITACFSTFGKSGIESDSPDATGYIRMAYGLLESHICDASTVSYGCSSIVF